MLSFAADISAQNEQVVAWMREVVEIHSRSAVRTELETDVRRRNFPDHKLLDERLTESLCLWVRYITGNHVVLSFSPDGYFHEAQTSGARGRQEFRYVFRSSVFATSAGGCCRLSFTSRAGNELLHNLNNRVSNSRLRLRESLYRPLGNTISVNVSDEIFLQYDRSCPVPQNRFTTGVRKLIHSEFEFEAGYIHQWLFLKYPYSTQTNGFYVTFTVNRKHTT